MSARSSHHVLPQHGGREVHFHHRDELRRPTHDAAGNPIVRRAAALPAEHPAPTVLPVDCTGNASVTVPMDGNDTEGDCGPVMCAHVDSILTYGQGKPGFGPQVEAPVAALEAQYLQIAGGDNGTTQDQLVGPGGIWRVGVAGDATCVVADSLDVDPSNVELRRYCVDNFYAVPMGWSVPDDFLKNFRTGASFLSAMTADPNNGHWAPLTDLDANGNSRVVTWGGWAWVSDAFIASVQPETFVVISRLQFNAAGYDSHGRHVSAQAAKWKLLGGDPAKADGLVALFPAATPTLTPPAPVPAS